MRQQDETQMAVHRDTFKTLAKLRKGPMELWWHMVKLMECESPWSVLPSKLHADARVLVEKGLLLEDEQERFRINPEAAYISREQTGQE